MHFSPFDRQMMQRALQLAEQGVYSTKPNPAVGCVLTKDERIIGEGWHRQAGQLHAERLALLDAESQQNSVVGATAYVTLEPCSHTGRTSPCSDALINAKVARVVVAMQDPNPKVCGSGLQKLQAAGIQVDLGLMQDEAESLNMGFIQVMQRRMPYVRLKMAVSLDGRTAAANGESQWITGVDARHAVHLLRARHGAVITGIGSVLADDPSMTVRLSDEALAQLNLTQDTCQPLRIILDTNLRTPLDAKMLGLPGRTLIMAADKTVKLQDSLVQAFASRGITVVAVPQDGEALDLTAVLHYLADVEQINDVMVEAGAVLSGAFIQSGWVNELHCFMAPSLMGSLAKPMFELPGMTTMADKMLFEFEHCQHLGTDLYLILKPLKES